MNIDNPEHTTGVGRRTIMAGAAWTIPAIAIAAAAPANAAASGLSLAFDKSSYSGTLCTAISGAYVTATTGGVPAAGQSVTVSLGNGFAFENGLTSYTGVSGSDGRVSLPAIRVKTASTTSAISAASSTAIASSTVSSAAASSGQTARYRIVGTSSANYDYAVPTGSTVVGPKTTLDPDGVLRKFSATVASGVTSAWADWASNDQLTITWIDATGAHYRIWGTNDVLIASANSDWAVPTGSVVVGPSTTLDPSGVLRKSTGQISTGVTSAWADFASSDQITITWVDADGAHYRIWGTNGVLISSANRDYAIPAGSKVVGPSTTLDPNGVLRNNSTQVATGVTSAWADFASSDQITTSWVDATGAHYRIAAVTSANLDYAVPGGSIVAGPSTTLDPNGVARRSTSQLATGVTSLWGAFASNDQLTLTWIDGAC